MTAEGLAHAPLGSRMVIRYLIDEGERATDVLGELLARDDRTVTIDTKHGRLDIEREQIIAAKPVPPPPEPRSRRRPTQ